MLSKRLDYSSIEDLHDSKHYRSTLFSLSDPVFTRWRWFNGSSLPGMKDYRHARECLGISFDICALTDSGIRRYGSLMDVETRWVREIASCQWRSCVHIIAYAQKSLLFWVLVLSRSDKSAKRVIITWMSLRYSTAKWLAVTKGVISDDLFTSWSLKEIYPWWPLHPIPNDPEIFPSRVKLDPQMTRIRKFSPHNGHVLAWRAPVKQFGVVARKISMWSLLCITDESWRV
jgi:hypothetical protein